MASRWERHPSCGDWSGDLQQTCVPIPYISCMHCLVQSARRLILSNIFCSLLHMVNALLFKQKLGNVIFVLFNAYLCSKCYTGSISWVQVSRFHLMRDRSHLWNVVSNNTGHQIMPRITINRKKLRDACSLYWEMRWREHYFG